MKIIIDITLEMIAHLFTTAIEGGDPVTTSSRGGWCAGVYWKSKEHAPPSGADDGLWYADPTIYKEGFVLQVIEIDDESTGHETRHTINRAKVEEGLCRMAKAFPHRFAQILDDEVDAPCADIFLQCVLFGEEKYA